MNRTIFLIILLAFTVVITKASPVDSISTKYRNEEFATYCQVWVNSSDSVCDAVMRDYDYQMRFKLDALYTWALRGMNLRKEKNELMMLYFKSTSFNKGNSVLRGIGDVIIPGVITIPNIFVDCKLIGEQSGKGNTLKLNLLNSNGFIKNMNNSLAVIPSKNKGNWLVLESHVKFGWFFNIFITQNRFKLIMEWRLKRFIHNLKDEAERREKSAISSK